MCSLTVNVLSTFDHQRDFSNWQKETIYNLIDAQHKTIKKHTTTTTTTTTTATTTRRSFKLREDIS